MIANEYAEFQRDLRIRWPSVDQWLYKLPERAATLQAWFDDVFSDLELRDCRAVTHLVVIGQLDGPAGFSHLAGWYRSQARQINWERRQAEDKRREEKHWTGAVRLVQTGSMGRAFRRCRQIVREEVEAGRTREEALRIARKTRAAEWESELGVDAKPAGYAEFGDYNGN